MQTQGPHPNDCPAVFEPIFPVFLPPGRFRRIVATLGKQKANLDTWRLLDIEAGSADIYETISASDFVDLERWGWPPAMTRDDFRIASPPLDATPQSTKAVEAAPMSTKGKGSISQSPKQSKTRTASFDEAEKPSKRRHVGPIIP